MKIERAGENVFDAYSAYYDLLYKDKDYDAEVDYAVNALRQAGLTGNEILEFGSGTGRHGRLLSARGFTVFGVERSRSMVTEAQKERAQSGGFDCIEGDIRTVKLPRQFDVVLALFHVISYQTRDADVEQTFRNAARHLKPGGLFFFDVWHGPAVVHLGPEQRKKRMHDDITIVERTASPVWDREARLITVRYAVDVTSKIDNRVHSFSEEHRMRYFFPEEIDSFARKTGFTVQRSEQFLTGQPPCENTWGVAYLLR